MSFGLSMLAELEWSAGRMEEAASMLEEAVAIAREIHLNHYLCGYLQKLAAVAMDRGKAAQAEKLAGEALELAESLGRPDVAGLCRVLLAEAVGHRDPGSAAGKLRQLLAEADSDGLRGEILIRLQRLSPGPPTREQAIEVFRRLYSQTPQTRYRRALEELKDKPITADKK